MFCDFRHIQVIPRGIKKIAAKFGEQDRRTRSLAKNSVIALVARAASILATLLIVPLTINYLNSTNYGIWLTIASVVTLVNHFDLGLGQGFKNRFAECLAKGDDVRARQYVSTTYFAITCVVAVLLVILLTVNSFISWSSFLKVPETLDGELSRTCAVIIVFTCLNMIANIFSSLLAGDQRPATGGVILALGQYLSLLVIFILTKVSTGTLFNFALYYSGIPCIVMGLASIVFFAGKRYRKYAPRLRFVKTGLIRNILNLGIQFFVINICLILVFQIINVVILRELGAENVTRYNIANRYFGILYMVVSIVVMTLWPAFTDAYTLRDFAWMKKTGRRFDRLLLLGVGAGLLMLAVSGPVYRIWIGDSVQMPFAISAAMLILILCQCFGNVYMNMINGIGTIRIQLILYVIFALLSWPMFSWLGRNWGLLGIVLFPSLVYLVQGLFAKLQLEKIINQTAGGIWAK